MSSDKYTESSGHEKPKDSDIYKIFGNTSGTKLAYIYTINFLYGNRPKARELPGSFSCSPAFHFWVQDLCSVQLQPERAAAFRELLVLLSALKKLIESSMKKHQIHSYNVLKALKSSPAFSLKLFLADGTVFGGEKKTTKQNKTKTQHNKRRGAANIQAE